jgi:hypothetical protein
VAISDPAKICTSHVERQNLTIRMQMGRMTRLMSAFSKKWDNLWAAYCVHFAWYNSIRRHQTLRMTPAMAVGITKAMWTTGTAGDRVIRRPERPAGFN